ncbi:MAG: hypothetical protein C4B59_16500 [Candidatus Methanogaster sp.]|uniref:Uncharacterized protein n=1 Tax=Candidatus Methanogaster sp. TaxID=3386292 RepID=A0AC61KY92_9EURY|nr:MAG: hypothetical protein C4B59_16500 [ANME-2 cluster archaeon]
MKIVRFIVGATDGYITVNNMEASNYQVSIPKPIQGGVDTDAGDNIEIAKSWKTHISKKSFRKYKGRVCSGVEKRGWQFEN